MHIGAEQIVEYVRATLAVLGTVLATSYAKSLQPALDSLPPEFRAAVVLCDIEGLSYEEIGATLGVKLGTVRSRIHRGRAQLRAALDHRRPRHPEHPAARLGTPS